MYDYSWFYAPIQLRTRVADAPGRREQPSIRSLYGTVNSRERAEKSAHTPQLTRLAPSCSSIRHQSAHSLACGSSLPASMSAISSRSFSPGKSFPSSDQVG